MTLPEKEGNEILTQFFVLIKDEYAFISPEYKNQRNDSSPGDECCETIFTSPKKLLHCPTSLLKISKKYKGMIENIFAPVITLVIFGSSAALEQYQ